MKIQIANLVDTQALVELEKHCFQQDLLNARQIKHFIRTGLVIKVMHHDAIVASAIVIFRKNSNIARLYSIAVHELHRKLGIAKIMLNFIEDYIQSKNCREIRLEVKKDNIAAIKFYQKHHYEIFGEYKEFYEDGSDAFRMRKMISAEKLNKL